MESYLKLSIWICICQLILLTLFVAAASDVSHNKYKYGDICTAVCSLHIFYMFHAFVGNCTAQNSNKYELNTLALPFPFPFPHPFLCPLPKIYNIKTRQ